MTDLKENLETLAKAVKSKDKQLLYRVVRRSTSLRKRMLLPELTALAAVYYPDALPLIDQIKASSLHSAFAHGVALRDMHGIIE